MPRPFTLIAALVMVSAISPFTHAVEPKWGPLRGAVRLDGDILDRKPLVEQDSDVKDAAVCAAQEIPDEQLLVDPISRGLANVIIYLPKAPAQVHQQKIPAEVRFEARACRYEPHVLIVHTDQRVRFQFDDPISHQLHAYFPKRRPAGEVVKPQDPSGQVYGPYDAAERLPVEISCDVHPWMRAHWVVLDHSYAAVTDKQGEFEIPNLPVGEHEFIIWHELRGYIEKNYRVNISEGLNQQQKLAVKIESPKQEDSTKRK